MNRENWKTVKLGDLCEISAGGTPSRSKNEYWKNGTIPWVKIGDFSGKYLSTTSENITEEGLNNSSAKLFTKGTVLYSIFATLGEVSILDIDATTNQAIAGLKIKDSNSLNTDYFYSYLKSLKDEVNQIGRGVAQNNINLGILRNFEIPLPPLDVQKQIALNLDQVTKVIAEHKELLAKYDLLIKSRFIEMFGEKNFTLSKTEELCDFITKGTTPPTSFISEEKNSESIPYLKVYNLSYNGELLFNEKPQFIPNEIHKKLLARSQVYSNDVLMNIVGPPLGKFAFIPESFGECNINQAIAIFRAKEKLLPIYLLHALMQPEVLRPFIGNAVGIRQQNLSLEQCRNIQIPVPPLELQQQFADFVQQIDKSKLVAQQSLEKAETLYKSLMQEYFG